jgi:LAS superfamily LD-carboxypeptidase LdcB
MCGGGYRDPAQQVALRRAHCGSSDYAIYQAPSSACSPPTARPGTSMHEQGLAIDVTCGGGAISRGSACFGWLQGHAAGYGLHNLPSEPWHWSTDGS